MSEYHTKFNTNPVTGAERITAYYTDQCDLSRKQLTVSYDYALNTDENHLKAARALDKKLDETPIINTNGLRGLVDEFILVIDESTKSGRGYTFKFEYNKGV
jgi:hypothetical protein